MTKLCAALSLSLFILGSGCSGSGGASAPAGDDAGDAASAETSNDTGIADAQVDTAMKPSPDAAPDVRDTGSDAATTPSTTCPPDDGGDRRLVILAPVEGADLTEKDDVSKAPYPGTFQIQTKICLVNDTMKIVPRIGIRNDFGDDEPAFHLRDDGTARWVEGPTQVRTVAGKTIAVGFTVTAYNVDGTTPLVSIPVVSWRGTTTAKP